MHNLSNSFSSVDLSETWEIYLNPKVLSQCLAYPLDNLSNESGTDVAKLNILETIKMSQKHKISQ
jgi:hypothetical protein